MSSSSHPGKIAIVVDNPRRDLRGLVLLAHQLALRGVAAVVVPMYQQGYDIPLIAPDLVVVNYARESNRPLLETYRSAGYGVAVLDTEGGILSSKGHDAPDTWAASICRSGLSALIDHYAFWGENVHHAFVRHSGIPPEKLWLTGCPRYDLCVEPWRSMLRHTRRDFILVNTNFSAINPRYTRSASEERAIFRSLGWTEEYVKRIFADLERVFPVYLETIESLARAFPKRQILVRPHPFENESLYRERFAGIANIVIDGAGDVLNVISASDGVIHLNCGTAVDAVLCGKVPISIEYLNTETIKSHAPLPSSISLQAGNFEELCAFVETLPDRSPYDIEAAQAVTRPWFHHSDGLAAARLADLLVGALATKSTVARRSATMALRGGRRNASVGQVLLGLSSLAAGSAAADVLRQRIQPSRTGKAFGVADVAALLQDYAACSSDPAARVRHARNPLTKLPLSSIEVFTV